MKTLLIAIFAMFATMPTSADQVTPTKRITKWANVWADQVNRDDPPAYLLKPGDSLPLRNKIPYYYVVTLPSGEDGYVAKSVTRVISNEPILPQSESSDLQIHFIDVGQGDSTLVVCPSGDTILIDARSFSGVPAETVRNYINGVVEPHGSDIDTLVITHPDGDHYNLISEVLDKVSVGQAFYVGTPRDYRDTTAYAWITEEPKTSKRLRFRDFDPQNRPNSDIDCGDADVWVLAASVNSSSSTKNAKSIVLMIRYGDFEAVLTGDATTDTEDVILSRYAHDWLNIDLLKIGHHGSRATSTGKDWAKTLKPSIAVASSGANNNYGHPSKEIIDRLIPFTDEDSAGHAFLEGSGRRPHYQYRTRSETERVFNTASSGTVVVRSNGNGYHVTTER